MFFWVRGVEIFGPNLQSDIFVQRFNPRLTSGWKRDSQNLVQQDPAEKKLWGSKVEIFAFCMGISVHGDFGGMKS
jgi:hypothetical protein